MAKITLAQAAVWCGGKVEPKYADVTFLGASNDSRNIMPGQLFVALQGAASLGTTAAYVVVVKILTKVKIIIAFIVFISSSNPIV